MNMALSPPVDVQRGDLLGVSVIGNCGGLPLTNGSAHDITLRFPSNPSVGTNLTGGSLEFGVSFDARASTSITVVGGIIVGAGSARGDANSLFKTDVQLTNNTFVPAIGRFVFHPAGVAGSSSDPFLGWNVPATQSVSITDVVGRMGLSGLGSIDVVAAVGDMPVMTVRVYSDNGVQGTAGFTEEVFPTDAALRKDDFVPFAAPADPTNFRMNIGVRTLGAGATIRLGDGPDRVYPANYFRQFSLSEFSGVTNPVANQAFTVTVFSGSLFIYVSTTDNRTNDSSIQFLKQQSTR